MHSKVKIMKKSKNIWSVIIEKCLWVIFIVFWSDDSYLSHVLVLPERILWSTCVQMHFYSNFVILHNRYFPWPPKQCSQSGNCFIHFNPESWECSLFSSWYDFTYSHWGSLNLGVAERFQDNRKTSFWKLKNVHKWIR